VHTELLENLNGSDKIVIKETGCKDVDWVHLAQDRDH
jgi:hypothetical protein